MKPILTPTENYVTCLRLYGYTKKEIAGLMYRAPGTIKRHLRSVYEKAHVHNDIQLYNWYMKTELKLDIRKLLLQ